LLFGLPAHGASNAKTVSNEQAVVEEHQEQHINFEKGILHL
jgi:hypothetical protein